MGTDIHGIWQKKINEGWKDIPSEYTQDRHYQLFAVLAGVRNGYGFAGVQTGQPVTPIAEPKGLPDDFLMDGDYHPIESNKIRDPQRQKYWKEREDDYLQYHMGDHSFSWLSGQGMLTWYENAPSVVKTGIVDRKTFNNWDGVSAPESYCLGISGPNVVFAGADSNSDWTHIRVNWNESLKDSLSYFFNEVYRLVREHGEIRFVFGVDS